MNCFTVPPACSASSRLQCRNIEGLVSALQEMLELVSDHVSTFIYCRLESLLQGLSSHSYAVAVKREPARHPVKIDPRYSGSILRSAPSLCTP